MDICKSNSLWDQGAWLEQESCKICNYFILMLYTSASCSIKEFGLMRQLESVYKKQKWSLDSHTCRDLALCLSKCVPKVLHLIKGWFRWGGCINPCKSIHGAETVLSFFFKTWNIVILAAGWSSSPLSTLFPFVSPSLLSSLYKSYLSLASLCPESNICPMLILRRDFVEG